jgi:peptide/nickel transport system ATP-binding protein
MTKSGTDPILHVKNLSVRFAQPRKSPFAERQFVHAVRDISFSVKPGLTLGLVGESGSGKTTTAMAAIRLVKSDRGEVFFQGRDLMKLSPEEMRSERRNLQVIFQDP